jgi:hypothetical protein
MFKWNKWKIFRRERDTTEIKIKDICVGFIKNKFLNTSLSFRLRVLVPSVSATPRLTPCAVVAVTALSTSKRRPVLSAVILLPRSDLSTGLRRVREERPLVLVAWLT